MGGVFHPHSDSRTIQGRAVIQEEGFFTHIQNKKPLMDEAIRQGFFTHTEGTHCPFYKFSHFYNVLLYHGHNNKHQDLSWSKHHFLGIPCYRDKGFTPHNPGQDQLCARHNLLGYITKEQGKQKHNYLKWTVLKYRRNNIGIIDAFKFPHN